MIADDFLRTAHGIVRDHEWLRVVARCGDGSGRRR
jgi:hypothetical protein